MGNKNLNALLFLPLSKDPPEVFLAAESGVSVKDKKQVKQLWKWWHDLLIITLFHNKAKMIQLVNRTKLKCPIYLELHG